MRGWRVDAEGPSLTFCCSGFCGLSSLTSDAISEISVLGKLEAILALVPRQGRWHHPGTLLETSLAWQLLQVRKPYNSLVL
jgi:hypothetical protein